MSGGLESYRWWGLAEERHVIKWMKSPRYEQPGWMTKDAKGEWYLYIVEDNTIEEDYRRP